MIICEEETNKRSNNLFENFTTWTKIHYYAFKNRHLYPNLFFHYFSLNGIVDDNFSQSEISTTLTNLRKYKKNINGLWGYLSTMLKNKNGIIVFKEINNSSFYEHTISLPCIQDGEAFSPEIKVNVEEIFKNKKVEYQRVEDSFENYLKETINESKEKSFKSFLNEYEDKLLFVYNKTSLLNILKTRNDINFIKPKENIFNVIHSKFNDNVNGALNKSKSKKKIIEDEEIINPNKNISQSQSKINKKDKINSFLETSESEDTILQKEKNSFKDKETIFSSPNKNYLNSEYDPSYIMFEEKSNCISDYAMKVFTSEKKKYASDDEEIKTEKKKNKKIFLCKSNTKKFNKEKHFKKFSMDVTEIKKLRKDLLNRKTKRDSKNLLRLKAKFNWAPANKMRIDYEFDSFSNRSKVNSNQSTLLNKMSKKRKHHSLEKENETIPIDNFSKKKFKYSNHLNDSITENIFKLNQRDDDRSVISSNSSTIANRKKEIKNISMSIKNFFTSSNSSVQFKAADGKFKEAKTNSNKEINLQNMNKTSSILNYFPQVSNANTRKESEIIKNISKLIGNSKYNDLISLLEKNKNFTEYNQILNIISSNTTVLINKSNEIDCNVLNSIMKEEMSFQINNFNYDFLNDSSRSIKKLFEVYKYNMIKFIDQINLDSKSRNGYIIHENEDLFFTAQMIKESENLIKFVIKNYNKIRKDFNFSLVINEIKEIYISFLTKLFPNEGNAEEDAFSETIVDRLVSFLVIIKVIYTTCKAAGDNISLSNIEETTLNFIKISTFLILIKIYGIDIKRFDQYTDQYIYISLLQIISDIYSTMSSNSSSIDLINKTFNEYLYEGSRQNLNIQTNNMKSLFIENCKDLFAGNFFDHATFNRKLQFSLFKIFILITNKVNNINEYSNDLKKLLLNELNLQLYHRYFNMFFIIFCESSINKYEDFFHYIISSNSNCYYDIDGVLKNLDNLEFKKNLNCEIKGNLIRKYLLSDSKTILLIEKIRKIEPESKLKIIFTLLSVIGSSHRKNLNADDQLNKKNIYQLLDTIFTNNPDDLDNNDENNSRFPMLIGFLLNICIIVRNILIKNESDDKGRMRFLSKFLTELNKNKNLLENARQANINENKLGIIPMFAIVLSLLEFTNLFETNDLIEKCVKKICEILDLDKSSSLLKGFSIAILLMIITKFSKKKMNVVKYIDLINENINSVINLINELEQAPNSDNGDKLKDEHLRTLEYFFKIFIPISKDDPYIIINNFKILEVFKSVIKSNSTSKNCKRSVFTIIENTLSKFDELVEQSNNIKKRDVFVLDDGLEFELEIFDVEMNAVDKGNLNLELNQSQQEYLKELRNSFIVLMDSLINNYFATINQQSSNIARKNKISIDILAVVCEVYAKLEAILIKYSLSKYTNFFSKFSSQKSNFFAPNILKYISNNMEIYETLIFLPFKSFTTFIQSNNLIFKNILLAREYKHFQHFIRFFFYSLLYTCNTFSRKNTFGFTIIKNKNDFINEFYNSLIGCKQIIEENLKIIKLKTERNNIIMEIDREESTYYNILLFILNNFTSSLNATQNINALEGYFFLLFEEISLSRNINKIEVRFLFDLLNDFDEIVNKNLSIDDDSYSKTLFLNTVKNILFKILNLFNHEYIHNKLEDNLKNFVSKMSKFVLINDQDLISDENCSKFVSYCLGLKVYFTNEIFDKYLDQFFSFIFKKYSTLQVNDDDSQELSPLNNLPYYNLELYLLIADYVSNYDYKNGNGYLFQIYYFYVYSILEEIINPDNDFEHNYEFISKLILSINIKKFSLKSKHDLYFLSLIFDKIIIYFDYQAMVNSDKQFSSMFIDKLFSLVYELIKFTNNCQFNKSELDASISNTDLQIIIKSLNNATRLIDILKEFCVDNSDKFQCIKKIEYLIIKTYEVIIHNNYNQTRLNNHVASFVEFF